MGHRILWFSIKRKPNAWSGMCELWIYMAKIDHVLTVVCIYTYYMLHVCLPDIQSDKYFFLSVFIIFVLDPIQANAIFIQFIMLTIHVSWIMCIDKLGKNRFFGFDVWWHSFTKCAKCNISKIVHQWIWIYWCSSNPRRDNAFANKLCSY